MCAIPVILVAEVVDLQTLSRRDVWQRRSRATNHHVLVQDPVVFHVGSIASGAVAFPRLRKMAVPGTGQGRLEARSSPTKSRSEPSSGSRAGSRVPVPSARWS